MASKVKHTQATVPVDITKAEDFRSLYVNNFQVQVSLIDFRLVGAEATSDNDGLNIEQKISLVMSPQQAKLLSQNLSASVASYERQNGTIAIPDLGPPDVQNVLSDK